MRAATPLQPWLRSDDVYPLLGFKSLKSFQQFLATAKGQELPRYRMGKFWLFIPEEVDAFRRGLLKPVRRRAAVQHADSVATVSAHE